MCAIKLERSLRVARREQHDFGHVSLAKPLERTFEGVRIQRDDVLENSRRAGGKTLWIDEVEGGNHCGVEAMCLSRYRELGWKGYHSEGGIVRTLVTPSKYHPIHPTSPQETPENP